MNDEQNTLESTDNASVNAAVQAACRNCGATLRGQFCAVCGQKEVDLNPTMLDFMHEVWHELMHVDGKLIPSVRLLINAPGALTLEHYEGRRARYISPMRMYLVFSILYFAVAAFTPDTNLNITVGADPSTGWTFEPRPVEKHSDPDELRKLGFESDVELRQATSDAIMHWLPRMMFLLVPLFAALTGLATRRLQWNYPRHVHFTLHLHAAWFLLLTISTTAWVIPYQWIGSVISSIVAVSIVVYFVLALRRTYSLTTGDALWRAMAVGVSYSVLLILAVIIIVLPIVINGKT